MSARWIARLRFLLGSGAFVWEVGWDRHDRLWVIVAAVWLLGAPIEDLVRLFSDGRVTINLRRNGEGEEP